MTVPSARADLLRLLHGERLPWAPSFSGLIHVTAPGLQALGLALSQVHHDPARLAAAAASTHHIFGLPSAVVPLDLCVEAEALGATVDFRADSEEPLFPLIATPLANTTSDFPTQLPTDLARRGRVPVVCEALRLLKNDIGDEAVIGAVVPGPFTLALYVLPMLNVLLDVTQAPEAVTRVLDQLTDALIEVARAYRAAGADFITVHEMGGSPSFLGPRTFETLVLPRLQRLLAALPKPRVLSVCGNTNRAFALLAAAGADAISVDQLNDLARSREALTDGTLLFGNIDPVGVLVNGDPDRVRHAVAQARAAGVDAVWPGCDLWPAVPEDNLRAFAEEG